MEKNLKHSGTRSTEVCQREIDHAVFAREAAEEGIVLLKNEGLLPLKKDTKIALLGIGAEKTIKGGTGSGDVNNRESVSIYAGMKEKNAGIVSEEWLKDYHNRYEQARTEWKEQSENLRVTEEQKKFIADFYKYSFVGVMLDWIKRGMKEAPEEIANMVCVTMHGNIGNSLRNMEKEGQ